MERKPAMRSVSRVYEELPEPSLQTEEEADLALELQAITDLVFMEVENEWVN